MNKKSSPYIVLFVLFVALIASPAFGEWTTSISKDEMTGKQSAYASSAYTSATEKMNFPYTNVNAWLGVGCSDQQEWAYVGFSISPNLSDVSTEDGYNLISTRIKWDDQVENVTLKQEWGSSFLHFSDDKTAISKIAESSIVLLELNWYGAGKTYFRFSLKGSSAALAKIRRSCNGR